MECNLYLFRNCYIEKMHMMNKACTILKYLAQVLWQPLKSPVEGRCDARNETDVCLLFDVVCTVQIRRPTLMTFAFVFLLPSGQSRLAPI